MTLKRKQPTDMGLDVCIALAAAAVLVGVVSEQSTGPVRPSASGRCAIM